MLYGPVAKDLLDFLHDPLHNTQYLDGLKPPSWGIRLMARTPLLRRALSQGHIIRLLGQRLRAEIDSLKVDLDQQLSADPQPPSLDDVPRWLATLGNYFDIDLPAPPRDAPEHFTDRWLEHRESHLWAKLGYTCNRITENLRLPSSYNFSILQHSRLWLAYYLSESLFLMAQGLMLGHFRNGHLVLRFSPLLERELKSYWLSEVSEYHSNSADQRQLQTLQQTLVQLGHLPPPQSTFLVDLLLDKCLSIHAQYIQGELKNSPLYQYLRDIVYIAGHLQIRALCGQQRTHYSEFAHQVSPATLSLMASALSSAEAPPFNSPQNFIQVQDGFYLRGALNLKYGLKKVVGHLLIKQKNPGSKEDFGNTLGNNFERDYIVNYIRALESERYKVYGELKAGNHAQVKGYDVDLVLHDQAHDQYYFIQVKYRLRDQPTYLSEQYQLMFRDDFHRGYAKQLLILKQHLNHPSIRQKLAQNGLAGAREDNSHFILLHNLPFLNYHQTQGVLFYEWNRFRNLLKAGRISVLSPGGISQEQPLDDQQLWQLERIVEAHFQDGQSGHNNRLNYALYRASRVRYRFADLDIVSDLF